MGGLPGTSNDTSQQEITKDIYICNSEFTDTNRSVPNNFKETMNVVIIDMRSHCDICNPTFG